jgi:hypothetical protein
LILPTCDGPNTTAIAPLASPGPFVLLRRGTLAALTSRAPSALARPVRQRAVQRRDLIISHAETGGARCLPGLLGLLVGRDAEAGGARGALLGFCLGVGRRQALREGRLGRFLRGCGGGRLVVVARGLGFCGSSGGCFVCLGRGGLCGRVLGLLLRGSGSSSRGLLGYSILLGSGEVIVLVVNLVFGSRLLGV